MNDSLNLILDLVRDDLKNSKQLLSETPNLTKDLITAIGRHRLVGYVRYFGEFVHSEISIDAFEGQHAALCQTFYRSRQLLSRLSQQAKDEELDFVVIKGVALNDCIYGEDSVRSFGDLDILIRPQDANRFHRLLESMGFLQKAGPTSSAMGSSRDFRAFMAVNMKRMTEVIDSASFPVKAHQCKPEFKPYRDSGTVSIEVHDGIYFLSDSSAMRLIEESIFVTRDGRGYRTLSPEHTLILLFVTTFENSEAFFSNSYDFGAVLRDYVDIRFFFEKYHEAVDWAQVDRLIHDFGLSVIVGTILSNLLEVYQKDVTFGCLPSHGLIGSEWGSSILERMDDHDLARRRSLAVMRQRWHKAGGRSILSLNKATDKSDLSVFHECRIYKGVFYNIEYTETSFILMWALKPYGEDGGSSLLYQLKFFPLADAITYTAYSVDMFLSEGVFKAYGHRTNRYNLGAIKKETVPGLQLSSTTSDGWLISSIVLPFEELGLTGVGKSDREICVSVNVYRRHFEEIYHNVDPNAEDYEMSLIELRR